MTAKEHADQLVNTFVDLNIPNPTWSDKNETVSMDHNTAIWCAISTVNEVLYNSKQSIPILIPSNEIVCSNEYWEDLKKELEAML